MWILSSDGDALQGKRLWLRPGKKFLFGRTVAEGGQFCISDKTISRRHLTVEIEPVEANDCSKPNFRSKLILEDLNTKIGTLVNGEQKRGQRAELENDVNVVSLGRYPHLFRFTWVPVAFTFSFTGKEKKAGPFTELYATLGPLDINVFDNYIRGCTTHVVARKRNTPKGLQALVDGKFIVNDTFVAAIVNASSPPADGSSSISPLEEDFDANFPNPLEHLPPRGEEPTQRGSEAYTPDPARKGIFEGYTFIFYDRTQFNHLLPPITDGLGKALFQQVIPNETTVDDFVRYVKSVAGEKGLGEFEDGSEGKGVVVVRFNPAKGAMRDWFVNFGTDVSLRLDHRLIEQNEFLDAILNNNPSVLRRPLQVEPLSTAPIATAVTAPPDVQQSSVPTPSQIASEALPVESQIRRGRSRRILTSRFKGFDDDIDEVPIKSSVPESMEMDQPPIREPQSQGLFVSQDPEMDIERSQTNPPAAQRTSGRKRPSPIQEDDEEELMNQLAPAATALKKRRLADNIARRQRGESTPPPQQVQPEKEKVVNSPPKKVKKEIDVLEHARQQREKEEAMARAEREALEAAMEGMDIKQIRNLAVIEEMEIKRSEPLARHRAHGDEGDRWEERWNGRKNFKKFRRQGTEGGRQRRFDRVIVPLEEVKKRDFGIGDNYWFEGDNSQTKRKGKGKAKGKDTQDEDTSQSQMLAATTRAAHIPAEQAMEETPSLQQEERVSDDELPEIPPAATTSTQSQPTTRSQRFADKKVSQSSSPQKRPAANTLSRTAPVKKPRQAVSRNDSDESEDELKFRFRRRK
ncbi:hypothetical protein B7463_g5451, partial [Scytalidium lignicola]